MFLSTEPTPPGEQKDCDYDPIMMGPIKTVPGPFTVWHKLKCKAPCTVQQLIDHLKRDLKVKVTLLAIGDKCIYNDFITSATQTEKLKQKIEKVYVKNGGSIPDGVRSLRIEAGVSLIDGDVDAVMPPIMYEL